MFEEGIHFVNFNETFQTSFLKTTVSCVNLTLPELLKIVEFQAFIKKPKKPEQTSEKILLCYSKKTSILCSYSAVS